MTAITIKWHHDTKVSVGLVYDKKRGKAAEKRRPGNIEDRQNNCDLEQVARPAAGGEDGNRPEHGLCWSPFGSWILDQG